jgi:benzoylformate decarboxylase
MAQPNRPVVCVVGEGSVQYAVQAFWTATAYDVPLTVLVLRNEEYAILKWFAGLEQVEGAPGLDLPKLDCARLASAYGVRAQQTLGVDETREALRKAIESPSPELVEVRVAPGMAMF